MSGDGVTIQPHKKTTKNAWEDLTRKHLYKPVSVFRLNYRTHYHHPAIPSVPDRSLLSTNAMLPPFFFRRREFLYSPASALLLHIFPSLTGDAWELTGKKGRGGGTGQKWVSQRNIRNKTACCLKKQTPEKRAEKELIPPQLQKRLGVTWMRWSTSPYFFPISKL